MYESEADNRIESIPDLPQEVIAGFRDFRETVTGRTLLPWGEHCTECVWPTCYTSCEFYSPRQDGRCRRFVDGMVRVPCPDTLNLYLLKIRFKRWGKLWAPGNIHVYPTDDALRRERFDQRLASIICNVSFPQAARRFATVKRYNWKKRLATIRNPSAETPDLFVIECYNPGGQMVTLSLTMRAASKDVPLSYQRLIHLSPGYYRDCVPVEEIGRFVDLRAPFDIELTPNDIPDDTTLFFGLIDFVKSASPRVSTAKEPSSVKCIVWDLDNTLWNGILVEQSGEMLTLKPGIAEIIRELDRRGILHSIASKNNFDEAMAVLKRFSLDHYFVYPQVSWAPKSESVKTIAHLLNIGIDSLMFIDDSDFERAEVRSACSTVRILPAERYRVLIDLPECNVPLTHESSNRRAMYQQEAARGAAASAFAGDYLSFLRDCNLQMEIESLSAENLDRVHELTQRTNQMNFSGNRYDHRVLAEIAAGGTLDTYVIRCRDRFGSYGIVGFSLVDPRVPQMTDLMFSCRIQAKRVEHAFLAFILQKYITAGGRDFMVTYRRSPRNAPAGRVFQDFGMEEISEHGGVSLLAFRHHRPIPEDGIISITVTDASRLQASHVPAPASR